MITYALSAGAFKNHVTEPIAAAIRKSRFRNFEPYFGTFIREDEASRLTARLMRELVKEGVYRPASVHLPFYGYGDDCWDPSCLDEACRKDLVARLTKLVRDYADLMAPMVTFHASGQPPLHEHPQRIGQVCKSIEELLPVAREVGFVINVEFLPRTCVGNCTEELLQIVSNFDADQVGICLDVNHIMDRYKELPAMIDLLAPRIRSFHICDYDGVDENHWMPGQGIHDWPEIMRHIRAIDHDVLLILETSMQLNSINRSVDPIFAIRQNENACWFLENCERIQPEMAAFKLPGNQ